MTTPSETNNVQPTLGMPVTYHLGSDSYAGEIVWVSPSGHKVTVELSGYSATSQRDPSGIMCTCRRDGVYRVVGSKRGQFLSLGKAVSYLNPSF
jgi:hypothetical protein